MLKEFKAFITKEKLFVENDRVLLAVSGGLDSVVMCELFHRAGFSFGIAHCNFKLRGKESDEDEVFVEKLARKYKVPFYCKRFSTKKVAKDKKLSIQMAARDLRYEWFEEIRSKENYKFIATAHHLDDQIETFSSICREAPVLQGFMESCPSRKHWYVPSYSLSGKISIPTPASISSPTGKTAAMPKTSIYVIRSGMRLSRYSGN